MAVTYRIDAGERIFYLATAGGTSFAGWREAVPSALSDPAYGRSWNCWRA